MWLGLGSAGGVVALLSFTANLPDPDLALQRLWPSLALFSAALLLAGLSLLVSYLNQTALAEHYASASNRDRLNEKIATIPEVISAPRHIAESMNRPRDKAIKQSREFHNDAERAWLFVSVWRWTRRSLVALSSVCFALGVTYPLYLVQSGTRLTPPTERGCNATDALQSQH